MQHEIHVYHWDINRAKRDDESDAAVDARFKMGFRPEVDEVRKLVAAASVEYRKIAIIQTTNLDLAYEMTNSIHNNWFDNGSVAGSTEENAMQVLVSPCRSSMCGDIMVVKTADSTISYLVAAFGFTALPSIDLFIKE